MNERRTIGQILISAGRITEDDVKRALELQRDNGGYFGEALVASGVVNQNELEWGLASQFDLPYVFPDADSIDLEAAGLVSADWALANLTLPILRTDRTIKVLVDSPLKVDPIRELEERTGLDVDLALAAPASIRDMLRDVFGRIGAAEQEGLVPVGLSEMLNEAFRVDSARFGISVRGAKAYGWWDDPGAAHRQRRPLSGGWSADLDRLLIPGPSEMTVRSLRTEWSADLNRGGVVTSVIVRYLADESGAEYAFEPRSNDAAPDDRFGEAPPEVASEVLALARAGDARFAVRVPAGELGPAILPHLPELLLDPSWRSIYVFAGRGAGGHETFSLRLHDDPGRWSDDVTSLRAFHFDALSVDVGDDASAAASLLDVAGVVFLLWSGSDEAVAEMGVRWALIIEERAEGGLSWSLTPLHG